MDEELQYFGLVENAKVRDSWSSWSVEAVVVLHLLFVMFLCCFVACMWWTLFCLFHGCNSVRHWSCKNLALFWSWWLMEGKCCSIWKGFLWWETTFMCGNLNWFFYICLFWQFSSLLMYFSCNKFKWGGLWGMNALTPWNFQNRGPCSSTTP
jgi:hypothetical protein